MKNTNLAVKLHQPNFEEWDYLDTETAKVFNLSKKEAEIRGFQKYYAHLPSDDDDIFNRLAFISNFDGGNPTIIEHGMYILAYIMVEGYKRSKEKDLKNGIYNPISNGKWNYKKIKLKLQRKINEIDCPDLDGYFIPIKSIWV